MRYRSIDLLADWSVQAMPAWNDVYTLDFSLDACKRTLSSDLLYALYMHMSLDCNPPRRKLP